MRALQSVTQLWAKGREAGKAEGHGAGETQPEKNLYTHTLWVSHLFFAIINTSLKLTTPCSGNLQLVKNLSVNRGSPSSVNVKWQIWYL